jgi:hypothetical protein
MPALPADPSADSLTDRLDPYLFHLPKPVRLVMWGDPALSWPEEEGEQLGQTLSGRYPQIQFALRPRRINFHYYPVLGVMGLDENEEVDHRVRMVGLPAGVQINSLVGAVQAVAFQAQNIETKTRILLSKLTQPVKLELMTGAENEAGAVMSTLISGLAVASAHIAAYTVMADLFPQIATRYSVRNLPHLVINGRYHVEGLLDEERFLPHLARAIRP